MSAAVLHTSLSPVHIHVWTMHTHTHAASQNQCLATPLSRWHNTIVFSTYRHCYKQTHFAIIFMCDSRTTTTDRHSMMRS